MARQLSIVFQNLYRAIRPTHLLEQRWNREEENNPAFVLFSLIKNLSNLVVRTLLRSPSRVESFRRLLVLGTALLELRNFSGAFAVALGVSQVVWLFCVVKTLVFLIFAQHVVTRLEFSPAAADELMLRELMELVDSSRNYANYRSRLAAVEKGESCVPYLGLATQAITLVEEGNDTHLKSPTGEKLVNRDKVWFCFRSFFLFFFVMQFNQVFLMWGVLEAFLAWQDAAYPLQVSRSIRSWLVNELITKKPVSEEELYELSYAIKGRAGEPENAPVSSMNSGYF